MAYELVTNGRTQFAVDWSVVVRFVRAYHMARFRSEYTTVKTVSEATWNPFSWSLPEITTVEVDWGQVRDRANLMSFIKVNELRNVGDTNMRYVATHLMDLIGDTARYNTRFLDLQSSTQSDNMSRIEKSVSSYETQKEIAKFFRDSSADALMVGATIATGGAGAAILAGGSSLKGYARYQDSDSVSAGVLTGVGNLGFGAFKMSKGVLVVVQSVWETGTCLIEGKSFAESVATGSLKLGGYGVDKVFKVGLVKQLLGTAALPFNISFAGENVAGQFVEGVAKKLLQKQGVERGGKAVIKSVKSTDSAPAAGGSSPIQTATYHDELLLKFTIVNMDKGIGHGW